MTHPKHVCHHGLEECKVNEGQESGQVFQADGRPEMAIKGKKRIFVGGERDDIPEKRVLATKSSRPFMGDHIV